jgi:shikimate kinase
MDDYYSPHPRVLLAEPLLLVGQVGAGTAQVARAIAARTGIPFADIDRSVENAAGCSLPQLVATEGLGALAERSQAALERSLARRPCAVIAGGSVAATPAAMRAVRAQARIVYVRRPHDVLLRRILAQLEAQPGSLYQFALATPKSSAELAPLFEAQEPALEAAHVILEAGSRHPQRLSTELIASLDRIAGAEPL